MGAGSNTGSVARHTCTRKVDLLSSLAIVALLAVPATTLAGKGGGTSTPAWIALSGVSGGALAAAQPRLGASVSLRQYYTYMAHTNFDAGA